MDKFIVGDTRHCTFTSSGNTFSPMVVNVLNGNDETLITSASMIGSGSGYYADVTMPTTPGFYTVYFEGVNSTKTYKRSIRFELVKGNA